MTPRPLQCAPSPKKRGQGCEGRARLGLVMRPVQGASFLRRSRRLICEILLAVLLHVLCFGLVMAHAHFICLEKSGGPSTREGKNRMPGTIIGRIDLPAVNSSGQPQAPPVPAVRAETPAPGAAAAFEKTANPKKSPSAVIEENGVPAILPQGARPTFTRQPKSARSAKAETETASGGKGFSTNRAEGGNGPEREPSNPRGAVAKHGGTGDGGAGEGGLGAPEGLVAFGGSGGPSFKHLVKPEYPAQARRQGISGQVLLCINLNAKGSVERVEVVKSAHDLLSKAALEAVEKSSFHPLRRDGKPVACSALLPVSFNLERS